MASKALELTYLLPFLKPSSTDPDKLLQSLTDVKYFFVEKAIVLRWICLI